MSERPLVSFIVLSYKQEQFIRDAIRSAFEQAYEPLEIVFSDDCSPDRTFEIIKEEVDSYRGPHKIVLNHNESNLGLAGNVNRAFELAKGLFFVMAAGDDISVCTRTTKLVHRWQDNLSPVDLVSSYFEDMDVDGKPTALTEELVKENAVYLPDVRLPVRKWRCGATGACAGYSRKLYDRYGPLDPRVIAEDAIFPFRAWLESGIALIEEPLVKHRTHDRSLYVIHRNVNLIKQAESRRLVRQQATGDKLARYKDWLRAWQIARNAKDGRVEAELEQLIRLLELEWQAYDSGRVQALRAAILSLGYRGGGRSAMRLIFRQVLCRY